MTVPPFNPLFSARLPKIIDTLFELRDTMQEPTERAERTIAELELESAAWNCNRLRLAMA